MKIELSGANFPGQGNLVGGLKITAATSTVQGLVINKWENGVFLQGTGATGNKVEGNFIGTDAAGNAAGGTPVSNNTGVVVNGHNNTIGGTTAAARNIISGNGAGVQIGSSNEGNKVQGNYIGTNASGTQALGTNNGVLIAGSPNNTIGGTTATARNIISGNFVYGINIFGDGATDNQVQGKYIGTDASGTQPLGNGNNGVSIQQGAAKNTIGGTTATAGNVISGNGNSSGADPNLNALSGVEIQGLNNPMATGNRILSNSIYDNVKLGIDLYFTTNSPGVTVNDPNDPTDLDGGPNNLQNFPEITSTKPVIRRIHHRRRQFTLITGTLNSNPGQTFTLQFFSSRLADPEADQNGHCCYGEGKTFIGQLTKVTTDASGKATFGIRVRRSVAPVGSAITATATNNSTGDTSEFSASSCVGSTTCPP